MAKKKTEVPASTIDHSRYAATKFTDPKTGKTRSSMSNGDAVARALMHLSGEDQFKACARKNKLGAEVADRTFPNPGMLRLALGNRLRAIVRRGEVVVIGQHEVKSLAQRVPLPEAGEKKAARPRKRKTEEAAQDAA